MKILFFASIAEVTGTHSVELNGITTLTDLKLHLLEQYPELKNLQYAIAVNQTLVSNDVKLNLNDEVALLPPFSGG